MKPDIPHEHIAPPSHDAAQHLSHEAFAPPVRAIAVPVQIPSHAPVTAVEHVPQVRPVQAVVNTVSLAPHDMGGKPCPPKAPEMPHAPAKTPDAPVRMPEAPVHVVPVRQPEAPHNHETPHPVQPPHVDHAPKAGKPCPPGHKPDVPPPVKPAPPEQHHPDHPTKPGKPCPPGKTPPVDTPTPPVVVTPPVDTPTPPVVVVPPVVTVPPVDTTPVRPGRPTYERVAAWSPPAEPTRPFRASDFSTPPARVVENTPAAVTVELSGQQARSESTVVTAREKIQGTAEVTVQDTTRGARGTTGHARMERHVNEVSGKENSGRVITGHHAEAAIQTRTQTGQVVVEENREATASVAQTSSESVAVAARVEVQSPAAQPTEVPVQSPTYKSWAETTVSNSPHYKSTTVTQTVGHFFNDQNYGYVQGTVDATRGKAGDVSAMYGHTLLSPYDAEGNVRRGNINVEAGVIVHSGEAVEGSKLPVFGKSTVRVGVNGYYDLDKEGKNTVYGSVDYAGNPKQADAQVGIAHRFDNDVTVSAGYEVSKVAGYRTSQFATTAVSMRLNDRTELYTGAAVSAHKEENRVYAGVRFKF